MRIAAGIAAWLVLGSVVAQGSHAVWRPQPEVRPGGEAFAFDPIRRRVVRFGGGDNHFANKQQYRYSNDTWEWDGVRWELRRPNTSPAPRNGHSLAYDHVSRRVILFGGANGQQHFGDTWAWDGQDWKLLKPKNSPQARYLHSVASDPLRKRIVLFGGALGFFLGKLNPLQDTWEWDGNNWFHLNPKTVPGARCRGGMAFCAMSKRIVLFGGTRGLWKPGPLRVTWEWNGVDWTKHASAPLSGAYGPLVQLPYSGKVLLLWSKANRTIEYNEWDGKAWNGKVLKTPFWQPRAWVTVANDASKTIMMLVPGVGNETITWGYNGQAWKKLAQWVLPDSIDQVVHDAAHDQTIVLGNDFQGTKIATWVLDQGRFKRLQPKQSPSRRVLPAVIYHAGLRKVWAFGGRTRYGYLRDLWLWDGSSWTQIPSVNAPTWTQVLTAYAYDPVRDKVLLFMPRTQTTWEWDIKVGWTKRITKGIPKGRDGLVMAYDPSRKKMVMVGPEPSTSILHTYEWTGKDWAETKTQNKPGPRVLHLMQYVPRLGGIVLFGGYAREALNDTWVFNGKDWVQVKARPYEAHKKSISYFASASYNINRHRIVAIRSSNSDMPKVSELHFEDLKVSQGYPRPGGMVRIDATIPSQKNRPILFLLSGALRPGIPLRSVSNVGVEYVPLAPDRLFWASLSAGLVTMLDQRGYGTFPLTIPNTPAMVGVRFHSAGVVIQPGVGIPLITNAIDIQVVR